jgi:hypothetical protein
VLVRCGPLGSKAYVVGPLIVVGVLLHSETEPHWEVKLAFYQPLPTMRHIVLIYCDQRRVERKRCSAPTLRGVS